jgi:RNA polymerase sigma-B factor
VISSAVARSSPNDLVASFHYLCARGARRFVRSGLERSDLEQVAAVGLIKASRRFDPAKQTPFEAYAWGLILGELLHYVRDHERPIRIPRRIRALERDVSQAEERLTMRLGRPPSDAEIAATMGTAPSMVAHAHRVRHLRRPLSIDDAPSRAIAGDEVLAPEDRLFIARAFASLGEIERRVVGGVYLLGLTQAQLAVALELSPKRVSRIHLAALARMRSAWAS